MLCVQPLLLGGFCDCKNSNYLSPVVSKAAEKIAHAFYDMKASMNLEMLKFPWNCSITSATSSEDSELADDSISEKFIDQITASVMESGLELMKGTTNKGPRKNLLVHRITMKVQLMGKSSERDMMDMSKWLLISPSCLLKTN